MKHLASLLALLAALPGCSAATPDKDAPPRLTGAEERQLDADAAKIDAERETYEGAMTEQAARDAAASASTVEPMPGEREAQH